MFWFFFNIGYCDIEHMKNDNLHVFRWIRSLLGASLFYAVVYRDSNDLLLRCDWWFLTVISYITFLIEALFQKKNHSLKPLYLFNVLGIFEFLSIQNFL